MKTVISISLLLTISACSAMDSNKTKKAETQYLEETGTKLVYSSGCGGAQMSAKNLATNFKFEAQGQQHTAKFGGVKLEFGSLPNPGHGYVVQLASSTLVNDTATVQVLKKSPKPGRMYAQVIVNPCAYLLWSEKTDVSKIQITDTMGKVLASWPEGLKRKSSY